MSQPFDASKSLATLEQDNTVIAVIEMSQSKWLVAAVVPGVKRQPLKKLQADRYLDSSLRTDRQAAGCRHAGACIVCAAGGTTGRVSQAGGTGNRSHHA